MSIWDKLRKYRILWIVVSVILLFGLGFAVGRWATPPQTMVTEKVREVEKQVVVEQVKTEVKVVRVVDRETLKKLHRETTELKHPDGREERKVVEDLNVNDVVHTKEQDTKVVQVDRVVEKWQDRIVEREKKVLRQPDWRVAAGVGVSIPYYLGQGEVGVPGLKGVVVDVGVDRRILGPFWLGVHGNTQGTASLSLAGVF